MKRKVLAILILLALVVAGSSGFSYAQQCPTSAPFTYSVKFICGLQTFSSGLAATAIFQPPKEPPVKPGNYATSVNIHNYLPKDGQFCKKAVVALTEQATHAKPGPISPLVSETLVPDGAMAVTCSDIVALFQGTALPPLFIEGFVEILSPSPLSVTAVYTSQSCLKPVAGKKCGSLGELDTEVVPQTALPPG